MSEVIYEVKDKIAVITLNRPEKLNAINAEMSRQLYAALQDVRDNDDVWLMILTGNGRAFSAGRDLVERADHGNSLPAPRNAEIYSLQTEIMKPTIAAINGICLAAASGFAFCTDIRIATEGATFAWPHAKRGISSVSGPTILGRHIPENIALEYMYTGKTMTAAEAERWGLVNRVVPDGTSLEAAQELAAELVTRAPMSMRLMKESLTRTRGLQLKDAFTMGTFFSNRASATEDAQEGLNAFKEKRDPQWKGR